MTAFGVVDLGFGDAGKGSVVDWLSRLHPGSVNIRFHGGPQAAHNVVTPDGRHHTFAQFGSGMFEPTTTTYLSEYMMVDPLNMSTEAGVLAYAGVTDAFERTSIHDDARIVTPYHRAINRLRELARGAQRHGTCGLGIGECASDSILWPDEVLRARHLRSAAELTKRLDSLRVRLVRELMLLPDEPTGPIAERERAVLTSDIRARLDALVTEYQNFASKVTISPQYPTPGRTLIFEGAQGMLLDEQHGFHPHTTWSDCTFANMDLVLAKIGHDEQVTRYGLTRTYMTRHGAGPFPTEELDLRVWEAHNRGVGWQGLWRQGWYDATLVRYAAANASPHGIDGLIVTHQDAVPRLGWDVSVGYRRPGEDAPAPFDPQHIWKYEPVLESVPKNGYCERIAEAVGLPLYAVSYGPTADDKLVL